MFKADRAVMDADEISPTAYKLFDYYCMRGGRNNPTCTANLERTAADLHLDYSYTSRKRMELIRAGWIILGSDGYVYILKGIEEYTEEAQRIVAGQAEAFAKSANIFAKKANSEADGVAKKANENCYISKNELLKKQTSFAKKANSPTPPIKDEPSNLTKQENQAREPSKTTSAEKAPTASATGSTGANSEPVNLTSPVSTVASGTAVEAGTAATSSCVPSPPKPENVNRRLMRELFERIGPVMDGAAQGKAVKHLEQGITGGFWTLEDCIDRLDEQLAEINDPKHWRNGSVSWLTVAQDIGTHRPRRRSPARASPADVQPAICATCCGQGFETVCDTANDWADIEIPCRYCERGRDWKPKAKGSDECLTIPTTNVTPIRAASGQ